MGDIERSTPLDYEALRPGSQAFLRPFVRRARIVAVPAVLVGVWCVTVNFRTMGEGGPWPGRLLLCGFFAVWIGLPFGAIAWLDLPRGRYLIAVVLTALLPVFLAEGYATLEEKLFLDRCRRLPPASPTVFKDRWWPNGNHYLYYEPATGELGGGD